MLPTNMDPNREKESCIQGVNPIIPKMFQTVPRVIASISLKFHENPLIDFTVMLLTDTLRRLEEPHDRQHGRGGESAAKCFRFVPVV